MGEEGLEPPTDYLEGSCSIQLSYSPILAQDYSTHLVTSAVMSTVKSTKKCVDV